MVKYIKEVQKKREANKMSSKIAQALKTINYKDVAVRAVWTFVQGFLAVILVVSEQLVTLAFAGDWEALKSVTIATIIGAVAAGFSALKTVIIGVIADIKSKS